MRDGKTHSVPIFAGDPWPVAPKKAMIDTMAALPAAHRDTSAPAGGGGGERNLVKRPSQSRR